MNSKVSHTWTWLIIFCTHVSSPDQNYYLQFLEETAGNLQTLSSCDDCSTDPISLTQPFAFGYIQHYNAYVWNLTSDNYYPHYTTLQAVYTYRAIATSAVGPVSTGPLSREQPHIYEIGGAPHRPVGSHVATVHSTREQWLQIAWKRHFLVFKAWRCHESPS